MPKKMYQKPLYLAMDFAEALERFGTTDPYELPENIKLSQKRKTGGKKPPVKSSQTQKNN
jgi:hypothetical protein